MSHSGPYGPADPPFSEWDDPAPTAPLRSTGNGGSASPDLPLWPTGETGAAQSAWRSGRSDPLGAPDRTELSDPNGRPAPTAGPDSLGAPDLTRLSDPGGPPAPAAGPDQLGAPPHSESVFRRPEPYRQHRHVTTEPPRADPPTGAGQGQPLLDLGPREPEESAKAAAPGGRLPLVLAAVSAVLLLAGLLYPEGDVLLARLPLWSLFALSCSVLVLVGVLRSGRTPRPAGVDQGLVGVGGLAAFWLLVVLPEVASNAGFLLTAAAAAAGLAVWRSRRR